MDIQQERERLIGRMLHVKPVLAEVEAVEREELAWLEKYPDDLEVLANGEHLIMLKTALTT